MTIISSQHFVNNDIVDIKMEELKGVSEVSIQCSYVGEVDGIEYAIQVDGHHTLAAARELDITVKFVVDDDCEGLTGAELLEARYMDGDYYNVETSNPYYCDLDLTW